MNLMIMSLDVVTERHRRECGSYWAHAFQCCSGHPPPHEGRNLAKCAPIPGEGRHQGPPLVRELVGVVPNELQVLA